MSAVIEQLEPIPSPKLIEVQAEEGMYAEARKKYLEQTQAGEPRSKNLPVFTVRLLKNSEDGSVIM